MHRLRVPPAVVLSLLGVLVPPRVHAQFRDITQLLPPGAETTAGVAWVDYDGDGDLDVFATTYGDTTGNERNRLYENIGARFVDAPVAALELTPYLCTGAAWADFDDDADPDVFIASESPEGVTLFRNDGGGAFVDITPAIMRTGSSFYAAVWVDHDLDGDLDLSVASRYGGRLYRNDGGGAFTDRTLGPLGALTWSVEWHDWDDDGDPDAFLGTVDQPLVLAQNEGGGSFRDVAQGSLGGGTDGAFSGGFADYDGDGDRDLYVTYFYQSSRLFRNDGAPAFVDVTPPLLAVTGAAFTSSWSDFDLDGDPDLLRLGQVPGSTALFRNDAGAFRDVSTMLGSTRQNNVWSGAWGDWNDDGRPDLFLGINGSTSDRLLRNDSGATRHWLNVELHGTLSNRDGIGARVEVAAGGLTMSQQISGGGDGWCSQEPTSARFGLGAETTAHVEVIWPSGQRQTLIAVAADRTIEVTEPGLVSALQVVPAREAVDLNLRLDGAQITSATLLARDAAAAGEFTTFPLFNIGGVALRGRLPADFVFEAGIEYRVEYRLNGGTPRVTPFAGDPSAFLPAQFVNLASPAPLAARQFALFGFPFLPADSTVAGLLVDDLGEPGPTRWKLGRWDPAAGRYRQATDSTLTLHAGEAFWLIADRAVRPAASGRSPDLRAATEIALQPGWNQVAHPYFFPVALADVDFSRAPNVERRIVRYAAGGYDDGTMLEPWEGFWMHNGSVSVEVVVIPPKRATAARGAPRSETASAEWAIAFGATQGSTRDEGNEAGVAAGGADGCSHEDSLEPPGAPAHVRVWFEAVDARGDVRELTRDVRPRTASGHMWDLAVTSDAGEPVHLVWQGVRTLPAQFEAALVAPGTDAMIALEDGGALALPAGSAHHFRLVVGTREFVQSVRSGAIAPPSRIALGVPWPNPFSSFTTIGWALPEAGPVSLTIHDVGGRLVRTLVSGNAAAGRHDARWLGEDDAGRRTSSGVYFVRLRSGGDEATRKVHLQR